MTLAELPHIDRIVLARINRVPAWHPEHASFAPFPVHAWLVHHPDGPMLVDTGVGLGHPFIDDLYAPTVEPVRDALEALHVDPDALTAVVLSHLHFDHCGQQASLRAPVHVQADELAAAREPSYTVPEWARIDEAQVRIAHGDTVLVDGIRLVHTPGHTPGHQAVIVEGGGRRVVLGAQCAFTAAEMRAGEPADANLHDATWRPAARESLARVRAARPDAVHLSHDPQVVSW